MGVTHLSRLKVYSAKTVDRGGTVMEVTGTAVISGLLSSTTLTGNSITGTTVRSAKNVAVGSIANGCCGLKNVATAGTGVVLTSSALASSRIILTPIGVTGRTITACVSTIATGTSFTIRLQRIQTAGTAVGATGRVAWLIINK